MMRILLIALATLAATPALAQEQSAPAPDAPAAAKPPTPEQRIAELEASLARQAAIADNARQEVSALRADARLRDELLVLARDRNAELYTTAMEIAQKYVRGRNWEPFLQTERVKLENARQAYEDRLHAARFYESTLPPSVQQRMETDIGKGPGGDAAAAPAAPQP